MRTCGGSNSDMAAEATSRARSGRLCLRFTRRSTSILRAVVIQDLGGLVRACGREGGAAAGADRLVLASLFRIVHGSWFTLVMVCRLRRVRSDSLEEQLAGSIAD